MNYQMPNQKNESLRIKNSFEAANYSESSFFGNELTHFGKIQRMSSSCNESEARNQSYVFSENLGSKIKKDQEYSTHKTPGGTEKSFPLKNFSEGTSSYDSLSIWTDLQPSKFQINFKREMTVGFCGETATCVINKSYGRRITLKPIHSHESMEIEERKSNSKSHISVPAQNPSSLDDWNSSLVQVTKENDKNERKLERLFKKRGKRQENHTTKETDKKTQNQKDKSKGKAKTQKYPEEGPRSARKQSSSAIEAQEGAHGSNFNQLESKNS